MLSSSVELQKFLLLYGETLDGIPMVSVPCALEMVSKKMIEPA